MNRVNLGYLFDSYKLSNKVLDLSKFHIDAFLILLQKMIQLSFQFVLHVDHPPFNFDQHVLYEIHVVTFVQFFDTIQAWNDQFFVELTGVTDFEFHS